MKYERIKFLVIALKNSVEVYAWAPKPYHKFMAFKVLAIAGGAGEGRRTPEDRLQSGFVGPESLLGKRRKREASAWPACQGSGETGREEGPRFTCLLEPLSDSLLAPLQSFADLPHRPLLVELTVEEGQRLKVIYGSCAGFHAIDVDSGNNYDIYIPVHVSGRGEALLLACCLPGTPQGSDWSPFLPFAPARRSSRRSPPTPSSSCPTRTGWRCCCATKTRGFTSTPTGASLRMWCCSGERCPPLSVSLGRGAKGGLGESSWGPGAWLGLEP